MFKKKKAKGPGSSSSRPKIRVAADSVTESQQSITSLNISVNSTGFPHGALLRHGGFYMTNPRAYENHIKQSNSTSKMSSKRYQALVKSLGGDDIDGFIVDCPSAEDNVAVFAASGQSHILVVDASNKVRVYGPSDASKLNAAVWGSSKSPTSGKPLRLPFKHKKGAQVAGVAAGLFHSAAWSGKELVTWGYNINCSVLAGARPAKQPCGQLGRSGQALGPGVVPGLSGYIFGAACGNSHTLVLTSDGLFAFGLNEEGQLGRDALSLPVSPVAFLVSTPVAVSKVSCGGHHSLAISSDRQLYTWGWNSSAQLGHSPKSDRVSEPTRVEALRGVVDANGGNFHSVAVTAKGRCFSFGSNHSGCLGRRGDSAAVLPVSLPDQHRAVSVSCSGNRSAVCTVAGRVFVWGALFGVNHGNAPLPVPLDSDQFVYGASVGTSHVALLAASEARMARSILCDCMARGQIPEEARQLLLGIPEPYWTAFQREEILKSFPKAHRVGCTPASFTLAAAAQHTLDVKLKPLNSNIDSMLKFQTGNVPQLVTVSCQESVHVTRSSQFRVEVSVRETQASQQQQQPPGFFVAIKHGSQALTSFLRFTLTSVDAAEAPMTSRTTKKLRMTGESEDTEKMNPLLALVHAGKELRRKCELDSSLPVGELIGALVRYPDRQSDVTAYLTTLVMWSSVDAVLQELLTPPYAKRKAKVQRFLRSLRKYNVLEGPLVERVAKQFEIDEIIPEEPAFLAALHQDVIVKKGNPQSNLKLLSRLGLIRSSGSVTERGLRAAIFQVSVPVDVEYLYAARHLFEGFATTRVTVHNKEFAPVAECEKHWTSDTLQSLVAEGYLEASANKEHLFPTPFLLALIEERVLSPPVSKVQPLLAAPWTDKCAALLGDPLAFASQVTLAMSVYYSQIRPIHFLTRTWDNEAGGPLGALFQLVMHLSSWVATLILSEVDQRARVQLFSNAVDVADSLLELNNFCGVFAVVLGLQQHVLSRLGIEEALPSSTRSTVNSLVALVSHERNHAAYRGALERARGPVVPHVGIACTAVTFSLDGNETLLKDAKVNREKVNLISNVLEHFLSFQERVPYKIKLDVSAIEWLKSGLKAVGRKEDSLYELSYSHKPRNAQQN